MWEDNSLVSLPTYFMSLLLLNIQESMWFFERNMGLWDLGTLKIAPALAISEE